MTPQCVSHQAQLLVREDELDRLRLARLQMHAVERHQRLQRVARLTRLRVSSRPSAHQRRLGEQQHALVALALAHVLHRHEHLHAQRALQVATQTQRGQLAHLDAVLERRVRETEAERVQHLLREEAITAAREARHGVGSHVHVEEVDGLNRAVEVPRVDESTAYASRPWRERTRIHLAHQDLRHRRAAEHARVACTENADHAVVRFVRAQVQRAAAREIHQNDVAARLF